MARIRSAFCQTTGANHPSICRLMKKIFYNTLVLLLFLSAQYVKGQTINVTTGKHTKKKGMSLKAYKALIKSDKMVLVDFYADWCGPCKRIQPYLEEIKEEMGSKLLLLRVNADENTELCNELSVYSLPTLFFYKNGAMYWFNSGYLEKDELRKHVQ